MESDEDAGDPEDLSGLNTSQNKLKGMDKKVLHRVKITKFDVVASKSGTKRAAKQVSTPVKKGKRHVITPSKVANKTKPGVSVQPSIETGPTLPPFRISNAKPEIRNKQRSGNANNHAQKMTPERSFKPLKLLKTTKNMSKKAASSSLTPMEAE